ncbi:MAG: 4Fe-4S dicluster domain-containing protein [Bacteroidetes bacterium]|nr:MAG: 4Fe-4S dicluster domain-containing protein [Bacteroidota bacterium]
MQILRAQREDMLALAELYAGLAEAVAADKFLPDWLGNPGKEWPLWSPAARLASRYEWPALSKAVDLLADVSRRSPVVRQMEFEKVISGNGRLAPVMMYESQVVNGRFLGPVTFALQALYQKMGLETTGAELPDYAAVELDFLSFLAEKEAQANDDQQARHWRHTRRQFLQEHAGKWLPQLAHRLSNSGEEAWTAVAHLLAAALNPPKRQKQITPKESGLPQIPDITLCTLCSFCVQVCPTHALSMREDDHATRLTLNPSLCIRCHKCEQVCEEKAIDLQGKPAAAPMLVLRESPRATCPRCGKPTVSEAEVTAVVARLGSHPAWLDYCLECR